MHFFGTGLFYCPPTVKRVLRFTRRVLAIGRFIIAGINIGEHLPFGQKTEKENVQ